ncbi:MAG: tRNA(Ile)-lysidine synthase, partial [Gammaproteobacteria bacterium]|nr:tRNA(Ile)-lysidine synthase [Gammaproteobacteria bacterium]
MLLHAAAQAMANFPDIDIQAIHVHHGLSPLADQWADQCENQAKQWNIPYHIERLANKPATGESIEQWARQQRYACFAKYVQANHLLLTAHHQDDQAETVLLQLLRGAGPKGLSAMAPVSDFGKGLLARPFLEISRNQLEAYCNQNRLAYVDDHSNTDTRYDRNFIRHQVMPLLKQRWPACTELFSRTARNCAEQEQVLQEYIQSEIEDHDLKSGSFSINRLEKHSLPKQNVLLRAWIHQVSNELPSRQVLESIRQNIMKAAEDSEPVVKWGNWEFRRYQHVLYLLRDLPEIPVGYDVMWDGSSVLQVPTWPKALSKEYLAEQGLAVDKLDWSKVSVKLRQGGER